MEGEIRNLIRQVLAEELAKLKSEVSAAPSPPATREERVSIANDAELAAFVRRVMTLARDPRARQEIEQGRLVFRLGAPGESRGRPGSPAAPCQESVSIEQGVVSERQVDALAEGTTTLLVGKKVRLTPLARDRLRQRGIAVERRGT